LNQNEDTIVSELNGSQSFAQDIKGYYFPDEVLVSNAMRPSTTLNKIIDNF
jgi:isocitrate dehydrogenase